MSEPVPTLDEIAGERAQLGDLAWARDLIDRPAAGRSITEVALDWVRSDADTSPKDLRTELDSLEFIDARGRRSANAEWLRSALDPRMAASVRLFRRDRAGTQTFTCGYDDQLAVVVAKDSAGTISLTYLGADAVPDFVGRWIPLIPSWSFDGVNLPISGEELERAVTGLLTAPAVQRSQLDAMFGCAWVQWAIQFGDSLDTTEFVTVDGWGSFILDRRDESVRLAPVISGDLFVTIVRGVLEQFDDTEPASVRSE